MRVIVEFGMERDADLLAIASGDDVAVDVRELDCAFAYLDDARCPYEAHGHRSDAHEIACRVKARELAAVGVSLDRDAHGSKVAFGPDRAPVAVIVDDALGEQDESRAGAEHGHSLLDERAYRREHTLLAQQPSLHRGFASGQDEPVEVATHVAQAAQLEPRFAQFVEHRGMFGKRALHRQDRRCH